MKSKSTTIEKTRLRRDQVFRNVVTASGLLVLATFATLILHIFYNAAPLLYSIDLEQTTVIDLDKSANIDSLKSNRLTDLTNLYARQLKIEWDDCSLKISEVTNQTIELKKAFVPNCNNQMIGLIGKNKDKIAYIQNNQMLTVYQIDSSYNKVLAYSSSLPDAIVNADIAQYEIFQHNGFLRLVAHTAQNSHIITYTLNSVESPRLLSVERAQYVLPGKGNDQYTTIAKNSIAVINKNGTKIQTIDLESKVLNVGYSKSFLDLFILVSSESGNTNDMSLLKFSMVNVQGLFLFKQQLDIKLPEVLPFNTSFIHYDPIHNLLMVTFDHGLHYFINSVTGDIENVVALSEKDIHHVQYHRESITLLHDQNLSKYTIVNLASMANAKILFGKNNYSGYPEPDYIWQTSVSSDFQSPKYSVIPLIMGSIKASLLALIVAIPLSVGAAIYTAYFASTKIREKVKPIIEMLEAIPSVMIGFIAAVWFAPFAEQHILHILILIFSLPFVLILTALLKSYVDHALNLKQHKHFKLIMYLTLGIFLLLTFYLILVLTTDNSDTQTVLPLLKDFNLSKTSIVVALALGIAISPTIYSLMDDALYEVPDGVKQAAFALGATPIQTLNHVVIVVAFPSIIAAIMLGFGRAFGETMIVLMVTGNTPVADWDLFSGLRTLTSNLAIELQEARLDSTVYRILFFTAALLFMFTFAINTCASLLKKQLKSGKTIND